MKRELICIVCPRGCNLQVEINRPDDILVTGNACKRGVEYAINECTHPMRCVTTTMKTADGEPISVKTNRLIPKEHVAECMNIINRQTVSLPVRIGDVLIRDVFGSDIVATQNKE